MGCGSGHYTDRIRAVGVDAIGIDISSTAIKKAEVQFPKSRFMVGDFSDFSMLKSLKPELVVMCETSWYVLNHLAAFREFLRLELPNTLLFHCLTTYPEGQQQYGADFFTDTRGILDFFSMTYIEHGEVVLHHGGKRTYFLGGWSKDLLDRWLI